MAAGLDGIDIYLISSPNNPMITYGKELINPNGDKVNITDLVMNQNKNILYVLDFYSGIHIFSIKSN